MPGGTMTDQSDWVKLAERLGVRGSGVFIHIGNDAFHVKTLTAQDLLIGRALRVASEARVTSLAIDALALSVALISEGDARARAALELLDAVGYEHA
jgi:hypothetical protein